MCGTSLSGGASSSGNCRHQVSSESCLDTNLSLLWEVDNNQLLQLCSGCLSSHPGGVCPVPQCEEVAFTKDYKPATQTAEVCRERSCWSQWKPFSGSTGCWKYPETAWWQEGPSSRKGEKEVNHEKQSVWERKWANDSDGTDSKTCQERARAEGDVIHRPFIRRIERKTQVNIFPFETGL